MWRYSNSSHFLEDINILHLLIQLVCILMHSIDCNVNDMKVRAAAQALLLAELRRIGADGREEVIHTWAHHLPNYVDSSLSLLGSQSQASSVTSLSDSGSNESDEHEVEILSGICFDSIRYVGQICRYTWNKPACESLA